MSRPGDRWVWLVFPISVQGARVTAGQWDERILVDPSDISYHGFSGIILRAGVGDEEGGDTP